MKIIIATEVIHPGGAETFLLRLSEALLQKGYEVRIFNFRSGIFNRKLQQRIAPSIPIVCGDNQAGPATGIIDNILLKLNIDFSLRDILIRKSLKKLIRDFQPDIIHSHLFKTDVICTSVAKEFGIPVVSTMHGDYTMYYSSVQKGENIHVPGFNRKLLHLLNDLKCIVCISKEQEDFFSNQMQALTKKTLHLVKIYNGYKVSGNNKQVLVSREMLGIPKNAFVYGMVARGIPSKGWQQLIESFLNINDTNTYLVLVGGSEYLEQLKEAYKNHKNILFVGTVTNPTDWITIFDVGLLPSYFGSESLPTVIMEYLYCGKPVIATRIGEIPVMINYKGHTSGMLVDITNGETNVAQLTASMQQIKTDLPLYHQLQAATKICFQQFDMDKCVLSYEEIYKQYIA